MEKAKPTTHSCPHSSGGTYNFLKGCHESFSGSARPKENTEVMTAGYTCCQGACSQRPAGRPPFQGLLFAFSVQPMLSR